MVKNASSPNIQQITTFLNPLDALIPKIPFSFFADFWVRVISEARGSVSVGIWGSRQLSPFFWGGVSSQGALSTPPPPIESPPTPGADTGAHPGTYRHHRHPGTQRWCLHISSAACVYTLSIPVNPHEMSRESRGIPQKYRCEARAHGSRTRCKVCPVCTCCRCEGTVFETGGRKKTPFALATRAQSVGAHTVCQRTDCPACGLGTHRTSVAGERAAQRPEGEGGGKGGKGVRVTGPRGWDSHADCLGLTGGSGRAGHLRCTALCSNLCKCTLQIASAVALRKPFFCCCGWFEGKRTIFWPVWRGKKGHCTDPSW